LCFCSWIPKLDLQTRVIILMHTGEEVLPSNTARLAARGLINSEIRINGRKGDRLSTEGLVQEGRQSLLLYPSPFASELTPDYVASLQGPFNLIVPDGKWRQTQKFARREPALAGIPHVKVPEGAISQYRLRLQPNDKSLCTLEAIARALGALESRDAQTQLETVLKVMVERTLWARGMLPARHCVTGGIPDDAYSLRCPPSKRSSACVDSGEPESFTTDDTDFTDRNTRTCVATKSRAPCDQGSSMIHSARFVGERWYSP
jgi:DTW domain-containing protein YfiP